MLEKDVVRRIESIMEYRDWSDEEKLGHIEHALDYYNREIAKFPAKYIKIFNNESGYLKFDTKIVDFTVGAKDSMGGWYQTKFKRSEINPELYDKFGVDK